jgi:hypothetical protein
MNRLGRSSMLIQITTAITNIIKRNFLLASNRCRLLHAKLWDIETVNEFDYVLARIYDQTQSFDSPRIAVNFTMGKSGEFHLIQCQKIKSLFFLSIKIK